MGRSGKIEPPEKIWTLCLKTRPAVHFVAVDFEKSYALKNSAPCRIIYNHQMKNDLKKQVFFNHLRKILALNNLGFSF